MNKEAKLKKFSEELPDQCPPSEAVDAAYPNAFRFVDASSVSELTQSEFLSHAALGVAMRNINACELASCSFFESETCIGFEAARKLPKLRAKNIAVLKIPEGSGRSIRNHKGHISLWSYEGFDPISNTKEVKSNAA